MPDGQGDNKSRKSRLSTASGPRVTQMVPPMLKPASAAPPQRSAPAQRPARAVLAAARRCEALPVNTDEAPRRGNASSAGAAVSSPAEPAEQSSIGGNGTVADGGALHITCLQTGKQ